MIFIGVKGGGGGGGGKVRIKAAAVRVMTGGGLGAVSPQQDPYRVFFRSGPGGARTPSVPLGCAPARW